MPTPHNQPDQYPKSLGLAQKRNHCFSQGTSTCAVPVECDWNLKVFSSLKPKRKKRHGTAVYRPRGMNVSTISDDSAGIGGCNSPNTCILWLINPEKISIAGLEDSMRGGSKEKLEVICPMRRLFLKLPTAEGLRKGCYLQDRQKQNDSIC